MVSIEMDSYRLPLRYQEGSACITITEHNSKYSADEYNLASLGRVLRSVGFQEKTIIFFWSSINPSLKDIINVVVNDLNARPLEGLTSGKQKDLQERVNHAILAL